MSFSLLIISCLFWRELVINIYERKTYGKKNFIFLSTNFPSYPQFKNSGFFNF